MDPIHQQMDKNYEMYRNRWMTKGSFKMSDLYAYVETVVPILTNNRVRASVHSDYPEYVQHAQGLNDILDHTYDINNWDYLSQKVARQSEIYRSAIAYTGYDTEHKNGTGKLLIKPINIRWCYLDPGPTEFEDSSFFFYVEPKRKTEVISMYPDKKSDIIRTLGSTGGDNEQGGRKWFKSFFTTVKNWLSFNDNNTLAQRVNFSDLTELSEEEKRKNMVAFIHYWYRDEEDNWRVSYWADDLLLEDTANPFYHGQLPYDIYNPTDDILSSLGVPISEHIEEMNEEKNMIMNYISENAKLHADPPMLYNTAYGNIKDPESMNELGKKNGPIPVNNPDFVPLNAIRDFLQPPTMPGYTIDMPDRIQMIQDRITGVNDSFRGLSDATSGKEVQLKQEAAYTRIKTKIDNFELFNKKIAEKIIINAMQFYDTRRAFRIYGDYMKYEGQELPFDVQPIQTGIDEQGEPEYDRSHFFLYANPNEWTKLDENSNIEDDEKSNQENVNEAFRILQMTVEIEAGSSLPQSRLARREEAMGLYGAGAIDQESLLDIFDWPDRDKIIRRMKEQQEMQAMQQQPVAEAIQPEQSDIASVLDNIRAQVPEAQQMTDEQLIQLFSQIGA